MQLYHPIKIGNLELDGNIFLAPVAGYSDRAFRSLCIENGASLCYTEMVSAEALVRKNQKTADLMKRAPNEKKYAVQIFGGNPEVMAEAAKIVVERTKCELLDINCGCPVPKIIKSGAGSELTRNPEKLYKVAKAVVEAVGPSSALSKLRDGSAGSPPLVESAGTGGVPVSVKIRSGWDANNITWKEATDAAIRAGVSAITIHPRTRAQGYEGKADRNILKEFVEFVKKASRASATGGVLTFASGDIFSPEDAKTVLEESGVDGVMFARGAMGNPFIFRQTIEFLKNASTGSATGAVGEISTSGTRSFERALEPPLMTVTDKERIQAGFRELDILIEDRGELPACRDMRKKFCAYTKGISGGAELRRRIITCSTRDEYSLALGEFL